jgi:hypothetical protein
VDRITVLSCVQPVGRSQHNAKKVSMLFIPINTKMLNTIERNVKNPGSNPKSRPPSERDETLDLENMRNSEDRDEGEEQSVIFGRPRMNSGIKGYIPTHGE